MGSMSAAGYPHRNRVGLMGSASVVRVAQLGDGSGAFGPGWSVICIRSPLPAWRFAPNRLLIAFRFSRAFGTGANGPWDSP